MQGLYKGNVYVTNMMVLLMGPPCVGKTSLKSLLFNWPAPKVHDSTALATRPIRAIERVAEKNEGQIWDRVTTHYLFKMLSDAIRAFEQHSDDVNDPTSEISTILSSQSTSYVTGNSGVVEERKVSSVIEESSGSSVDITEVSPTSISSTQPITSLSSDVHVTSSEEMTTISTIATGMLNKTSLASEITANPISQTQQNLLSTDFDNYSNEIVNVLAEREISEDLHKATWINILDSGGQPQFADVSRAFIRGNAIYIICTNLKENLSDKPQFFYSLNGKLLNQPSELQMTNLQLIEHYVRSIAASNNAVTAKDGKVGSKPFIMIIGTYYDKIRFSPFAESLNKKNAQILASLIEFRDCFIFHNESSEEVIFPVDNLCRLNRKKISSYIRERIVSFQKDVDVSKPIPVRWYMFELLVKEQASQEEHGMISLESCCAIGVNLNMNQDDVLKSVTYLNSMALVLYFPLVLPNVIFTNPQYLLDILSVLIRVSFVDLLEHILPENQSLSEIENVVNDLREDGQFDESLLDKLCLPLVSPLFTKSDFLELLQYLCIIASLNTASSLKRYFIPVVLPPHQPTDESIDIFTKTCDPMIITFKTKVVPQVRYAVICSVL